MDIQWYPGHMARARKQVQQSIKLVDVVIELLDARIPASSRNPDIDRILGDKPRVIILNKSDLADHDITKAWIGFFRDRGNVAAAVDAQRGLGVTKLVSLVEKLAAPEIGKYMARGRRPRMARCMVVGVPNVGKSMLINRLAGKKATRIANRPGVTRGEQWIKLSGRLELLDTPGILWPKFQDPDTAFKLAVTGAIKEDIYDPEDVCVKLVRRLMEKSPSPVAELYKNTAIAEEPWDIIKSIGAARGFYQSGGRVDMKKTAVQIIKDFRDGRLGKHTLDLPGR
ncbi:MAG: ribosome biogenesis GTPase YlqF [Firmicutes bacterium]|nr:ribosome biogenesis GTPase YlqF [Bacillota bacterium]